MAVNAVKMHNERHWDEEKFAGLMQEARRTHFDHFPSIGVSLKCRQEGDTRVINGTAYVWFQGGWKIQELGTQKRRTKRGGRYANKTKSQVETQDL